MAQLNRFLACLFLLASTFSVALGHTIMSWLPRPQASDKVPLLGLLVYQIPAVVIVGIFLLVVWKLDGVGTLRTAGRESQYWIGHLIIAVGTALHVVFAYAIPLAAVFITPWFLYGLRIPVPVGIISPLAWMLGLYLITRATATAGKDSSQRAA